jgi:hypothetical protein
MARGGSREKSTRRQTSKQSQKPKADSRKARPGENREAWPLDAAAVSEVVDDLRGTEELLGTASPLVEQVRRIVRTMVIDDPVQRDALAQLGHRLSGGGGDIDRFGPENLRLMDDDLLESVIAAADAVIEATLWRLDRLRCVLVRANHKAESRK